MKLLLSVVVMLLILTVAAAVRADLEICSSSESNQTIFVAVAYSQDSVMQSHGWVMIEPGECRPLVQGELKQRHYYLFAANGRDETVRGGRFEFCVDRANFDISGAGNCEERGFEKQRFMRINTGAHTSYRYEIRAYDPNRVEPEPLPLIP